MFVPFGAKKGFLKKHWLICARSTAPMWDQWSDVSAM
jgi:hypothetical protein